ncbi:LicD family protein [Loktanella sp. DSM 29012]|uniref:LicD family protein n=1 Tax=Loktanella sp. DSM 29012 TaxID=1881056 RepID=UPI0008BDB6F1|nr:LicD family protein [Loktanella sp. DSM 29012]SEQ76697.1 LicD family protein [Loktanella sp. DSM 29012]
MKHSRARTAVTNLAKSLMARRMPSRFGSRRQRHLLDQYEVADLIEVDGKIPLNYFTYTKNFGDLISPWLVKKMTGKPVAVADRSQPHYVVVGSITNQGSSHSILWGTGMYGTESQKEVATDARYTAVRGPLTRSKLSASRGFGATVPKVYGDPALLMPWYYFPRVKITHEYGVCVRWSERAWREASYGPGVKMIDFSRTDIQGVVRDMLSCRKIVTSSLHGLILADAYGIPSAWLASTSPRGGEFKFHDYFASVQKWRLAQELDLAKRTVTTKLLGNALTFNGAPMHYDYGPLLEACPFLRKKGCPKAHLPPHEDGVAHRRAPGTTAMLPSLGLFGGVHADYLSLPTGGDISKVTLFLANRATGQIDLRGLELFDSNGKKIPIAETDVTVTQSSNAMSKNGARDLFAFGGVRTKPEESPYVTVSFANPVSAGTLRVYNRRDGQSLRARALSVAMADANGHWRPTLSVNATRVVDTTLDLLTRISGVSLDRHMLEDPAMAALARTQVLQALAKRVRKRKPMLTEDATEQRLLLQLFPTQRLPKGTDLSDDEWTVLAHLLAAQRLRVPGSTTSMHLFQSVLNSKARLERLTTEVKAAASRIGAGDLMLARHGFSDVSRLRANADVFMTCLENANRVLEELGFPAMIGYGTLLGAVREGDFIAHDDDIDLMIPFEAANRAALEPQLAALFEALRDKGWRTTRPNSYTNFHMHDPATKQYVDVFPLLVNGENTSLHMSKMAMKTIPTAVLLPPGEMTFKGRTVGTPAQPEAFLEARYGTGWTVSDPYYDWPWQLTDDTARG